MTATRLRLSHALDWLRHVLEELYDWPLAVM